MYALTISCTRKLIREVGCFLIMGWVHWQRCVSNTIPPLDLNTLWIIQNVPFNLIFVACFILRKREHVSFTSVCLECKASCHKANILTPTHLLPLFPHWRKRAQTEIKGLTFSSSTIFWGFRHCEFYGV